MSGTTRFVLRVLSILVPVCAVGATAFAQTPDTPATPPAVTVTPRAVVLVDAGTAFGNTEAHWAYAGGVGLNLGTHLQVAAEFGRFDNIVTKSLHDDVRDSAATLSGTLGGTVTPNAELGANYGMAAIRFSHATSPHMGLFVDAGAGLAHVNPQFAATEAGLDVSGQVLESIPVPSAQTTFCGTIGGGVTVRLGPRAAIDAGYRFGRIGTTQRFDTNLLYGGWRLGW